MEKTAQDIAKGCKSTLELLLKLIDRHLAKNPHITPERFGWNSIKDTSLVERLRNGGDVTTRKYDAIIRYMSNPVKRGK